MRKLTEAYPFEKFLTFFLRQNRGVSKWDERRTDQDVFIRRTLSKWFEGKAFQVIFDKYVPACGVPVFNGTEQKPYKMRYTKYVLITHICFAFSPYYDEITVYYAEPHSTKIERLDIKRNDWYNLSIQEDIESWTILRKFYPFEKTEIKMPTL